MEDKNIKKKSTAKKKTVKKRVVKEEKSAIPNPEPFGVKFKRFLSSYQFLYAVFGLLFLVVIILGFAVYNKSGEESKQKSDIVFSIMEDNTKNYLDLNLKSLVGKEYVLKVTNYRNNKLNENEINYKIVVTNSSEAEIEILKNDTGKNLMIDQKTTTIEGEKFSTKEKEEVTYCFRVKNEDKLKDDDTIRIEVDS